ncbi:hypothetical protein TSMEX_007081 [Taenia solium]|eukprot:TsM_000265300 transcript=TsM_000265300 gene=TsM_000265300
MITLLLMVMLMLMINAEKYSGLLFFSPFFSVSLSLSLTPSLYISPFSFNLEVLTSPPPSTDALLVRACVRVCVCNDFPEE